MFDAAYAEFVSSVVGESNIAAGTAQLTLGSSVAEVGAAVTARNFTDSESGRAVTCGFRSQLKGALFANRAAGRVARGTRIGATLDSVDFQPRTRAISSVRLRLCVLSTMLLMWS